ncbi:Radial spoke head 14 [Araneus ventricosus]|uniref:Radial spoke head 14 n=1 Tax=Araneus ventricosus TaxID=182803 RepID=A0A4Y2HVF7_ARAVE|nr:Radial spoke head 14 [Araneus ventricosus]
MTHHISATPAGRQAFDGHGFYNETLNLLKDEDEEVRHAANVVLQRLVISPVGAEGLVEAGAIPVLIERISKEPDNTLEVLLQTLHICCLIDPESALDSKGLEAVIPLLKNSSPSIRARGATIIKDLTEEAKGRNRALDLKAVPLLLDMCSSEDEVVQAKALAALMMIALATPGKFMAVGENAIEKILPLVKRKNPEIRLNAIKVLTALSEAPTGRKQLIEKIPQLFSLLNDEVQEVRRAAKTLNKVITFKP